MNARRLAGMISILGVDEEWFMSDETVHADRHVHAVLDRNQPHGKVEVADVRWGGEYRVEIDLTARIVGEGEIKLRFTGKLFEGTSESTDDLEEEKTVEILVPRGAPVFNSMRLRNTGWAGGNHASIEMSFTNTLVRSARPATVLSSAPRTKKWNS